MASEWVKRQEDFDDQWRIMALFPDRATDGTLHHAVLVAVAEIVRLRNRVQQADIIAESFTQAAVDIATQKQAEIDTLWKALNAATREEGWE